MAETMHSEAPFDHEGGRTNCVYDARGRIVADCSDAASAEEDPERRAANACLFAAAPDLLASLVEFRDHLIRGARFGINDDERAMLLRADAAIGKAKGGTPNG